jgi:hypothetical protein
MPGFLTGIATDARFSYRYTYGNIQFYGTPYGNVKFYGTP